jgi:hypothetical protein
MDRLIFEKGNKSKRFKKYLTFVTKRIFSVLSKWNYTHGLTEVAI